MTDTIPPASPANILGVFLVVCGAGVILDGDVLWRGIVAMAAGVSCLAWARRSEGHTP